MFHRSIVEMQTGEGKTLTATLPMYLHALTGKGCQLATVNDYLAKRDADWMGPLYTALGLTVGVIQTQQSQPDRRKAYAADVTYGTAKEFGFDFLRDRLLLRQIREGQMDLLGGMLGQQSAGGDEKPVQRDAYFALVDEADSILIDEARTPLIISAMPTDEEMLTVESFKWAAEIAHEFVEDEDYDWDHDKKKCELTREGRQKARQLPKPAAMDTVGMFHIYEYVERAIKVEREFHLDRQYVVRDGEIVIVDEFTGRHVGRPQVARWHPSGRRGQDGRGSHRGNRPGGAGNRTGLLPPLRAVGRNDRHRHRLRGGTPQDLPLPRIANSHQPAVHPPAHAGLRFRPLRRQVGGRGAGGFPLACRRPSRAHRHPLDR